LSKQNFWAGGNYAYTLSNYGDSILRFDGTEWKTITKPEGVTQVNVSDFIGAGDNCAYILDNTGKKIYRLDNTVTPLNEVKKCNILSVYPNPAGDYINVKTDPLSKSSTYTIFDQLGQIVLKGKINRENTMVNISKLPIGIYTFSTDNDSQQKMKFIKK
jgi:hypothetical protein